MSVVTRFAPSPTGRLHIGNIRAAFHNWLWARANGGRMWLRIDDTDAARSKEEFVESIRADLRWLGLTLDGEARQSARSALYEEAFERLRAAGRIYPAYETAAELDFKRKVLLGRGLPPIYDRAALRLSDAERAALEAEGRRPHWRFRLDEGSPIEWDDLIRGSQRFDPRQLSDPVVRREDGSWLYLFPSVVDDVEMGVTHVVRGEDHVSNTAAQVQMFDVLGAEPPRFAHAALLVGDEGKLSKRLGSFGADELREARIEPVAVAALLARLGTAKPVEPVADLSRLAEGFSFADFGRAPARFDLHELEGLNARIVHGLPWEAVADRLPAGMDRAAWEAIRPNLARVAEAADWWAVVEGSVAPPEVFGDDDRAFLLFAADEAGGIDWAGDPWGALTDALKATGRKGRALFLPLRLALTGREHGPDMRALLPLIGRERAVERLRAAAGAEAGAVA